jgi:hypothetical protein
MWHVLESVPGDLRSFVEIENKQGHRDIVPIATKDVDYLPDEILIARIRTAMAESTHGSLEFKARDVLRSPPSRAWENNMEKYAESQKGHAYHYNEKADGATRGVIYVYPKGGRCLI